MLPITHIIRRNYDFKLCVFLLYLRYCIEMKSYGMRYFMVMMMRGSFFRLAKPGLLRGFLHIMTEDLFLKRLEETFADMFRIVIWF